jgi:4-hydroxy-3-polyprenylbenzoate decarboxylase
MKPIIVAWTGATGVVLGQRLVKFLLESQRPVHLVVSDAAKLVIQQELSNTASRLNEPEDFESFFGQNIENLSVYSNKDFTAPIASGSFPVEGMVILPCSMGTLGAIASGVSLNLIHRAADCVIKEGRRLVIAPRETPLSAIHLENMLKLARIGVRIVPPMAGFYSGVKTIDEMIDFVVGKILDQLEIEHALYPRWVGTARHAKKKAFKL